MSGLKYWAGYSGRKIVPGLLIGLGILIMVVTQILLVRFSMAGFDTGIFLVVVGITGLIAGQSQGREH